MQALRIVEAFTPVEQVNACLLSPLVPNLVHTLDFECLEEDLYRSVVSTVGFPTHRLNYAIVFDQSAL